MVLHLATMVIYILRLPNSLSKDTTGEMGIGLKVLGEVVSGGQIDPTP